MADASRDRRPSFFHKPSRSFNLPKRHQHSHSSGPNLITHDSLSSARPELPTRHSTSSSISVVPVGKLSEHRQRDSTDEQASMHSDASQQPSPGRGTNKKAYSRASKLLSSFSFKNKDRSTGQTGSVSSTSSMGSGSPPRTPYGLMNASIPNLAGADLPDTDEEVLDDQAFTVEDHPKSAPPHQAEINNAEAPASRWRRSLFSPFTSAAKSPSTSSLGLKKSASTVSLALTDHFSARDSIAEEPPVLSISNPIPHFYERKSLYQTHEERPNSMVSIASQNSATSSLFRDPPSSAQIITVQAVHKFGQQSPIKASLSELVADELDNKENASRQQLRRQQSNKLKRSDSARHHAKPIQAPDTAVSLSAHMHERQRKLTKSASRSSMSPRSRANSMKREHSRSQGSLHHKKSRTEGQVPLASSPALEQQQQQQQAEPLERAASPEPIRDESLKIPSRPPMSQSTASEDAVLTMSAIESRAVRRAS